MKISHVLTCSCGKTFKVESDGFDERASFGVKIGVRGVCFKCKKVLKFILVCLGGNISRLG